MGGPELFLDSILKRKWLKFCKIEEVFLTLSVSIKNKMFFLIIMKDIWKNLGIMLVSLVVCLIMAEVILRYTVQPYYGIPPGAFIVDDILDYKPTPGFSGYFFNDERENKLVNLTINSDGFRDDEHKVKKPNGVYRIFIIGDSMTMAEQVQLDETFTRKLQEKLGDKYEIFNLGVSGYGTKQEFEFYKLVAEKYNPDMVIYMYTPNDLVDNLEHKYTIVAGERVSYSYKNSSEWLAKVKVYLYRKSALLRTLYRVSKFGANLNSQNVDMYEYYGGDRAWEEMGKIINEMYIYFDKKKIKFSIVRNPDPLTVYDNEELWDAKYWDKLGKKLLNPNDVFVANSKGELFYKIDKHLTPHGHEVMSQFLHDKIIISKN